MMQQGPGKQQGGPAPFLTKTHQMVEDPATDEVLGWTEKGDSFVVWRPVEFARDLLPNYFKHNNFSSFVRQLNTYGFRKVVPERWEFANDNFRRGEQRLLFEIQRRKPVSAGPDKKTLPCISSKEEENNSSSTTSTIPPQNHRQEELLHCLSQENQKLKMDNSILTYELFQAKKHCETLRGLLSNYIGMFNFDATVVMKKAEILETRQGKEEEEGKGQDVKLFGVCLGGRIEQGERQRKKARSDDGTYNRLPIEAKAFGAPWMEISTNQL